MNKKDFLDALNRRLATLPAQENRCCIFQK